MCSLFFKKDIPISNYPIRMPSFSPVRIPTKGLPWWQKIKQEFSRRMWVIDNDYFLYIPWLNETIFIPKGFVFDGASVPRVFWPILDPVGILLIGSIFHDFGYIYGYLLNCAGDKVFVNKPQSFYDQLLRDITVYVNDTYLLNDIAYIVLRLFGRFAWSRSRKTPSNAIEDLLV